MQAPDMIIRSARLDLIPMTPPFLEACLAGNSAEAARQLPLAIPPEWYSARGLMQMRLDQLRRDPAAQPWLLRGIGLRSTGVMIGGIGFHAPPGADDLRETAPDGVEIGYRIFEPFRRQGYATEACAALIDWARTAHAIRQFVLSISPDNAPSLRIAQHFGFRKVGTQVDDIDGPEDVYLREWPVGA